MKRQTDGTISTSLDELLAMPFTHLVSGLDEDGPGSCGRPTVITGYTEWISSVLPTISFGWDWRLDTVPGSCFPRRISLPRTNVLLTFAGSIPDYSRNLELLSTFVDALCWQHTTAEAITRRYR